MTLHIFNKIQDNDIERCIENCTNTDAIVFIERAAIATQESPWKEQCFPCPTFRLPLNTTPPEPQDLNNPSISHKITDIDQQHFLELTAQHNPLVSW